MHTHLKRVPAALLAVGILLLPYSTVQALVLKPQGLLAPAQPVTPSDTTGGGATPTPPPSTGGSSTTQPGLASATIVVDAAQEVQQSGGNDLAAARALFRSASYPESNGGFQSSGALMNGIGTTHSRTINAEDGSYLDGSGKFFPSDRVGWNLDWIKRYNYNLHIIVGQRKPAFIAGNASAWGPADWSRYEDYATKFARYVATQYGGTGFPETVFEVGNEVDITGDTRDLWTLANPSVAQGDDTRYQHYTRIYQIWARAVDQVAREYPGRSVKVAGPALGGQSLFLTNSFWHERFIRDAITSGWRLDLVTHHFYGDILNGWPNTAGSSLRAQLQRIRNALTANGRPSTPVMVSEYGPSESSDSVFGRINYSHESAAWSAVFIQEALAGGATVGSYLLVRDNFGPDTTGTPGISSLTHIRDGVDYPKPNYNAFRMFTMMPGTRKAVTTPADQPDVRAVAAANASAAGLIVSNYNFSFNWPSDNTDRSVNRNVVPGFSNLPFNGSVIVERYLVDRNTSNVARYLDVGQTPDLGGASLTRVEQCGAAVNQGTLVLPGRTLGPSAVSLWLVRNGDNSGMPACQ